MPQNNAVLKHRHRSFAVAVLNISDRVRLDGWNKRESGPSDSTAKELGREPNPIELFEATHTRKTTSGIEYVDQRSKAVADRVQTALKETASQPVEGSNEPCEPDLRQLFLEAAGGPHFYTTTSSSHSTATSRDISTEQLRATIMQEMQQKVQIMLESQRQQMHEEFRLEIRQLVAELTRSDHILDVAPAPQRDSSHSDNM